MCKNFTFFFSFCHVIASNIEKTVDYLDISFSVIIFAPTFIYNTILI